MFDESDNDEFSIDKVVRFEHMIENDSFLFLDVEDFETIIDYYLEVEFFNRARKAVNVGLIQHPKNLSLSMILAEMLSLDQQYRNAINVLIEVLPLNPNNVELLLGIGRLNSLLEKFDSAEKYFSLALENSINQEG